MRKNHSVMAAALVLSLSATGAAHADFMVTSFDVPMAAQASAASGYTPMG